MVREKNNMNKIMMAYIDRVRGDPNTYVKEKTYLDRLCSRTADNDYPTLYSDNSIVPSYTSSMLYGLDFDFLMLNTLMIVALERVTYKAGQTKI